MEPHGNVTVLADRHEGRRLNSPNDLVYRSDGTLYFTDPPFGLPGVFDDPDKELPFSGVFRARDGAVALVTDELEGPNGLAFSPDERYLYVGNWDPERKVIMRYEVLPSGDVARGVVLYDTTDAPGEDAIDGLKVDRLGNLWVCGPGGIWVLSPGRRAPGHAAAARGAAQPGLGRRGRRDALHHGAHRRVPHPAERDRRAARPRARHERRCDAMSHGLTPGAVLPDFELPDDAGIPQRLSDLQGDDAMVLHAGSRRALPARAPAPARDGPLQRVVPGRVHAAGHRPAQRPARHEQDAHRHRRVLALPLRCGARGAADARASASTPTRTTTPTVPHTLVLAPGLVIDRVYVGYWYWGRPSPYQLWEDLQSLFRRTKADFDPTVQEVREAWMAAR